MHFRFLVLLSLLAPALFGQSLSPLAAAPDWADLEAFHQALTREEFTRLLETVYAPGAAARGLIEVRDDRVEILKTAGSNELITIRLATDFASVKRVPRYWRGPAEIGPAPPRRPLTGLRIALDPGHLGGDWARMEGRWFQIGESQPVAEGDMVLRVALHLAPLLEALGAKVSHVRRVAGPTTHARPADLRSAARSLLATMGFTAPREDYDGPDDPRHGSTVQGQSELLFYRMHEIRNRARLVNEELQPDLVLCLHFNAEPWGAPGQPQFSPRNHLHVLVNGCYSASELQLDDVRHDLIRRLLGGVTLPEQAIAGEVATVFAREAALPPLIYNRSNAVRVNNSPYLWARNLLANRLYRCPVIYLEPYVMNNHEVWERVQAGDYAGQRMVAGSLRRSLYREYAEAVADGLATYFRKAR